MASEHQPTSWLVWVKIGARNLLKNRRRSIFTSLAVAFGYAAINIFSGFTSYVYTGLRDGYVYSQGNGHLTVFKKGFLEEGKLDPTLYLLSDSELTVLKRILDDYPEVLVVAPQLVITGLLSNGDVSSIFVASGRVPSKTRAMNSEARGPISRVVLFTGRALEDAVPYGVGLSSGLARKLNLAVNSDAVAIAPTVDGQINALDAQVFQLFESPFEVLNNQFMRVPLKFAQSLYDTTGVDRVRILLNSVERINEVRERLANAMAGQGIAVELKTWEELSPFYRKTRDMLDVFFAFIFLIVVTIVVLSISNTIGMSILERTREIGTLRALGVKRGGIVRLFALESLLLGLFGSLFGLALTFTSWLGIRIVNPTWVPPQMAQSVPLEISLVPKYMLLGSLALVLLAVVAAVVPARRAARHPIVDALGHV